MDIVSFFSRLWSTQQAALPQPFVMYWALYGTWALVLGGGVARLTRRLPARYRWPLIGLVMIITWVPGITAPAYWLGLAFQTPSLTSLLLALGYLGRMARVHGPGIVPSTLGARRGAIACMAGALLGWVLLLDTLAWWPVSVYAWGFSPVAVAVVALGLALAWVAWGAPQESGANWITFGLPAMGLTIFVLLRLPTGNLWDALIDPWLWLGLQLVLLTKGLHFLRQRWSPATRA